jgi:hypothetical protein
VSTREHPSDPAHEVFGKEHPEANQPTVLKSDR